MEKSKYINIISNSCTKIEHYLYENYYNKQRRFSSSDVAELPQQGEEKTKYTMKSFEYWINEFGSIKQVYTTASLLQIMTNTSVYFLANEGDAILQESSFYSPADITADVKQGVLIDCKCYFLVYRNRNTSCFTYLCFSFIAKVGMVIKL